MRDVVRVFIVVQPKLLDHLLTQDPGKLQIQVLTGILGSGKTSILGHLDESHRNRAQVGHGRRPIRVRLEGFDPGHHGERGDKASVGAVQGSFQRFVELLESLIGQTAGKEVLRRFKEQVLSTRQSEIYQARAAGFEDNLATANDPLTPQHLAESWRKAAHQVAARFVSDWNASTAQQEALLLLDNFDTLEEQEIGVWLTELLPRLTGTLTVLTRESDDPMPLLESGSPTIMKVPKFDEEAVNAWLREKVGTSVSPELLRQICAVSDGHPATLALVHEVVWGGGKPVGLGPHHLLDRLPEQQTERLAVLAEKFVQGLDNELLSRVLQAAAVPRYFDMEMLFRLLDDTSIVRKELYQVFQTITQYSFVETLSHERRRLHPAVRQGLMDQLVRYDRALYVRFNEAAADYYVKELLTEERETSTYGKAAIYENPDWQNLKREWLYHRGLASDKAEKVVSIREFTKVFLEAFYWWGNYIHFDFCDQIVSDIKNLAHQRNISDRDSSRNSWPNEGTAQKYSDWPELENLYRAFRSILQNYPLRSAKPREADWEKVRHELSVLQELCGLRRKAKRREIGQVQPLERRVSALLNTFLAHTWRFEGIEPELAEEYYERAQALFDESWAKAWVAFERADVDYERGEMKQVSLHWKTSASIVQDFEEPGSDDEIDEELTANLHRLQGDLLWAEGESYKAAAAYGRAVLHAYLFNFVNGLPDEYTMQFYIDIRARALNRLYELRGRRPTTETVACALRMSSAMGQRQEAFSEADLGRLIDERRLIPLVQLLFPRGPEVTELEELDSPFSMEFHKFHARLNLDDVSTDLLFSNEG